MPTSPFCGGGNPSLSRRKKVLGPLHASFPALHQNELRFGGRTPDLKEYRLGEANAAGILEQSSEGLQPGLSRR